jgi:hypothetical protein
VLSIVGFGLDMSCDLIITVLPLNHPMSSESFGAKLSSFETENKRKKKKALTKKKKKKKPKKQKRIAHKINEQKQTQILSFFFFLSLCLLMIVCGQKRIQIINESN